MAAIVLAAGEGRRMGGPKALLRWGEETFLARVCRLLARPGVDPVIAVLGAQAARVRDEAGIEARVTVVVNGRHEDGMLSSVHCGLAAAEEAGVEAVLLQPVDHPLVSPETLDPLMAALREGALVAVPSYGGRRGHPGGFSRAVWPELRAVDPRRGARALLAERPERVVHVPGDAGCIAGVDTPGDYERITGLPAAAAFLSRPAPSASGPGWKR